MGKWKKRRKGEREKDEPLCPLLHPFDRPIHPSIYGWQMERDHMVGIKKHIWKSIKE